MTTMRSPDPENIRVRQIEVCQDVIIVTAEAVAGSGACPLCNQLSEKVHSRYWRTLADLPSCGLMVQWRLRTRRFWCLNEACQRKIFVERFPHSVGSYARQWEHPRSLLLQIAFVLGGRPGERLSHQLAMPVSNDSLIRARR